MPNGSSSGASGWQGDNEAFSPMGFNSQMSYLEALAKGQVIPMLQSTPKRGVELEILQHIFAGFESSTFPCKMTSSGL